MQTTTITIDAATLATINAEIRRASGNVRYYVQKREKELNIPPLYINDLICGLQPLSAENIAGDIVNNARG